MNQSIQSLLSREKREKSASIFYSYTQGSQEQNSALISSHQKHPEERGTPDLKLQIEPPRSPLRQITPKQVKAKHNCRYQFYKELPGNHSFSDLIIESVLNYRTRWSESQCSTSRTNKHAKIKCSGLSPRAAARDSRKGSLSPSLRCPGTLHTPPRRQFPELPLCKALLS